MEKSALCKKIKTFTLATFKTLAVIYYSLLKLVSHNLSLSQKIASVSEKIICLLVRTYIPSLESFAKVYKEVFIGILESEQPYINKSLSISLIVEQDGLKESWVTMKKSGIRNSGFGVYANRAFAKNGFVTVYLGAVKKKRMI